jgi:hypothetical protein
MDGKIPELHLPDWNACFALSVALEALLVVTALLLFLLAILVALVLTGIASWLDYDPRRRWVAEKRLNRLGRLAQRDAGLLEAGEEPHFLEAEVNRHHRRDQFEDAFKKWTLQ